MLSTPERYTMTFKLINMEEYKDEPLQFVGVYVLKWRPEWGEPTAGFVDDDETDERIEELQANKRELRAEIAALTSERDRLRLLARRLLNNLPDWEIELAREAWGNTNTRIIKEHRDALAAELDKDA